MKSKLFSPKLKNFERREKMKGFLIVFEGIDGAGKSTAVKMAARILSKRGIPCIVLKEPTDGPYGRELRNSKGRLPPQKEFELFTEDRKIDVKNRILPALLDGKTVIMDRYYLSSVAYQGARGLNPEEIIRINESFAPKPDLVILMDLNPRIAIMRIRKRRNPDSFEDIPYLEKVRELYLRYLPHSGKKTAVINAERPLKTVFNEIENVLENFLKKNRRF
uniref:Probable thymidylate kinase n=1 Tax=Archaeoglobus fulgidus TaxID=2234 RepID=A0A7C2S5X0_ARCFL